jgi:hypothetical protein
VSEASLTNGQSEICYQKTVEEAFRQFLTEKDECLWKLVDAYYGNPTREGEFCYPVFQSFLRQDRS